MHTHTDTHTPRRVPPNFKYDSSTASALVA